MNDLRYASFARRLRLLRERHHCSQERLAERLQVSVATINRWEQAKSYPRPEQRTRLCDVFGAEGQDLFVMEEASTANSPVLPGGSAAAPRARGADSGSYGQEAQRSTPVAARSVATAELDDSPFWNVQPVGETPLGDPALKQGKHPVGSYFERACFAEACEALRSAVAQGRGGLALFGPPMVGKTRLAREALLHEAPSFLLVPWPRQEFSLSLLHRFAGLPVALLLDDLHELAHQHEAGRIQSAVRRLLDLTPQLLVVITSRSGADEAVTRQHYDGLMESLGLAGLRLAPMARESDEARAFLTFARDVSALDARRTPSEGTFDGTPGSVLLGLDRRTSQLRSPRFPSAAKAILKALSLLRAAEVYDYPESRVRRVAEEVFELPSGRWHEALEYLIGGDWVSLDEGDLRGESQLYVPADAYLEVCLPESGVYPRSNRRTTSDFPKVCEALARAPVDAEALFALSRVIFEARREIAAKWNELGVQAALAGLAGLDPAREPELWARGQLALGMSYWKRWQGNFAENDACAIEALQKAETVLTREAYPVEWAVIQRMLAIVYIDRLIEPKDDLLERAIGCLHASLEVHTHDAFPYDWGRTHNTMGVCYLAREREDRAANVELGIRHYRLALRTLTRDTYPDAWARTMRNLAEAYSLRLSGEPSENEAAAIALCRAVLDEGLHQTFPYDWARTHVVLGDVYQRCRAGDRAGHLRCAVEHYEAALTVLTPGEYDADRAMVLASLDAAREALAQLVAVDSTGDVVAGLPPVPDDPDAPDCS